eukprot:scaffold3454_cov122-Isochrysis_galbana.AAC.1
MIAQAGALSWGCGGPEVELLAHEVDVAADRLGQLRARFRVHLAASAHAARLAAALPALARSGAASVAAGALKDGLTVPNGCDAQALVDQRAGAHGHAHVHNRQQHRRESGGRPSWTSSATTLGDLKQFFFSIYNAPCASTLNFPIHKSIPPVPLQRRLRNS